MLDKDKLFLIVEVGVKKIARDSVHIYLRKIRDAFTFDESVMILMIPNPEFSQPLVKFSTLNDKVMTAEEIESIIKKAESFMESLKLDEEKADN